LETLPPALADGPDRKLDRVRCSAVRGVDAALFTLQPQSFEPPWSRTQAEEWWSLHDIIGSSPRDVEFFQNAGAQSIRGLSTLVVAERTS